MTFIYPKITVITVVYNAVETILQTIKSVFEQTYPNLEYVIIDGKSTDGTVNVIDKFTHQIAYQISEKDDGIYDAMNKGIAVSTGDWIIFIGADDVFYNEEVLAKIFKDGVDIKYNSLDMIYGDVILKSKRKKYGGARTYYQLISQNINHQSIFYRKRIFEKMGLFNLKYKILSDYDFNLRVFREPLLKKKYIPGVVVLYNDKGLSNQVIDGDFYEDQLNYFINIDKISSRDYRLQTYFFFYGFALLLNNKKIRGLKSILHALMIGRRKFYYLLVSIKYFLSLIGFFKKIRASFKPKKTTDDYTNTKA